MLSLVSDVAAAYLELVELDHRLELAQQSLDAFKDTINFLVSVLVRNCVKDASHVWYAAATDIEDRTQAEQRLQNENVALREEIDKHRCSDRVRVSVILSSALAGLSPNGAAARLGIKRSTLYFRMQKLGISRANKDPVPA